MSDDDLRALLLTLDPKVRADLRRALTSELYGWPQTFDGGGIQVTRTFTLPRKLARRPGDDSAASLFTTATSDTRLGFARARVSSCCRLLRGSDIADVPGCSLGS